MAETITVNWTGTDRIAEVIAEQREKLMRFIRRRVDSTEDAEDILQEVFFELVEAEHLMQPVERVGAWLFRVARNRITDLFRRRKTDSLDAPVAGAETETRLEDLLPSPVLGPEAAYARKVLVEELEEALQELPELQREVFVAHEIEGRSFAEIAAATGENVNTLLSRKRYAVLRLRQRLEEIYNEYRKGSV